MNEMSRIYDALMSAKASNEALASWQRSMDGRDLVKNRERVINDGIAAYHRLAGDIREGRKHVEPPDDYVMTSCQCGAPNARPPCSWCTDPDREGDD